MERTGFRGELLMLLIDHARLPSKNHVEMQLLRDEPRLQRMGVRLLENNLRRVFGDLEPAYVEAVFETLSELNPRLDFSRTRRVVLGR